MDEKGHKVKWADDGAKDQPSATSYFGAGNNSAPKLKDRYNYFKRRSMNLVTTI